MRRDPRAACGVAGPPLLRCVCQAFLPRGALAQGVRSPQLLHRALFEHSLLFAEGSRPPQEAPALPGRHASTACALLCSYQK